MLHAASHVINGGNLIETLASRRLGAHRTPYRALMRRRIAPNLSRKAHSANRLPFLEILPDRGVRGDNGVPVR
jgi:hypothetical protein